MKVLVCLNDAFAVEWARGGFDILARLLGYESCVMLGRTAKLDRENSPLHELPLLYNQGADSLSGKKAVFPADSLHLVPSIKGYCVKYTGCIPSGCDLEKYYLDELACSARANVNDIAMLCGIRGDVELEDIAYQASCGYLSLSKPSELRRNEWPYFFDQDRQLLTMIGASYVGDSELPHMWTRISQISAIWKSLEKDMPPGVDGISEAATLLGMEPMMKALFSGVPLEDILG